jgi:hypothetical protein
VAFGTCRFCGAYFEQTEAVCPVCAAAAGTTPRPVPPSAPTESGCYKRVPAKLRLVPNPRANDSVFQSVFAAVTVLGAAVLGAIGGWRR